MTPIPCKKHFKQICLMVEETDKITPEAMVEFARLIHEEERLGKEYKKAKKIEQTARENTAQAYDIWCQTGRFVRTYAAFYDCPLVEKKND